MNKVIVNAPAKINLMLDVTGKRKDGYHTLITVMQSISLSDRIEIHKTNSKGIILECDDPNILCDSRNIAFKAADRFFSHTETYGGIHIKIQKNIPSQAGLGGGSADGAAVLVGLNQLYDTNLSIEELCRIGVEIGADVPFCIAGGTKLCRGIGEIMSDVTPLEDCFIVIGKGFSGISTKEAFEKIDKSGFGSNEFSDCYNGSLTSVSEIGSNIFESVTENSDVSEIKNQLMISGAVYSAMSGSGSAVFGLFNNQTDAEKSMNLLKSKGFFSALCSPEPYGTAVI